MECAIVTLAVGSMSQKMLTLVKPFFKAYSKKIGADFIVIDKPIVNTHASHLEKFQIYNLFEKYERIAYLDVDIIVQETTPNIFDAVPVDKIGIVYDNTDNTIRSLNRVREIQNVQRSLEDVNWIEGYANSGVIVLSAMHKKVFSHPELREKFQSGFKDQTLINYNFHKYGFKLHKLDKKFNGMEINGFSSRDKNPKSNKTGNNKINAYCMHFANEGNKIVQMYRVASRLVIKDPILKSEVKDALININQFVKNQEAKDLRISKTRREIPKKNNNNKSLSKTGINANSIVNPNEVDLYYDISELGWSMYLAAHLKYLYRQGKRVGVICPASRKVLYRDCTEVILPMPRLFNDKFGSYPSDGNHLFDHKKNIRIRDHNLLSRPFKRSYPRFNIITKYSKFEGHRIFEPYEHDIKMEKYCKEIFGNKPVIIVFPRHRTSKFRCRNIPRPSWVNIIRALCRAFPQAMIVSIGAINGAFDINISENNYRNLVIHNNDETLDILVALCNSGQAICTVGNQSGTVKIALLCKTPTYIFGDEKERHSDIENWSKTDCGFWEVKLTSDGYAIPRFQEMVKDIISFAGKYYYKFKQRNVIVQQDIVEKERVRPTSKKIISSAPRHKKLTKTPPPTSKFSKSSISSTTNIILQK